MFNGTSSSNDPFLILWKSVSFNKSLPSAQLFALLVSQSGLKLMCFYYTESWWSEELCSGLYNFLFTSTETIKEWKELLNTTDSRDKYGFCASFDISSQGSFFISTIIYIIK